MATSTAHPYHHGNLRAVLVDEAWRHVRHSGPETLTVRGLARRVGVSHNAAYRHFADRHELMAELSRRSLVTLTEALRAGAGRVASGPDAAATARTRLREIGRAYAIFAVTEPHLFRLAYDGESSPGAADPAIVQRLDGPYGVLNEALDDMVAAGALASGLRPGSELIAWSAVHGFADLCTHGPLRNLPEGERDDVLEALLHAIETGLRTRVV